MRVWILRINAMEKKPGIKPIKKTTAVSNIDDLMKTNPTSTYFNASSGKLEDCGDEAWVRFPVAILLLWQLNTDSR